MPFFFYVLASNSLGANFHWWSVEYSWSNVNPQAMEPEPNDRRNLPLFHSYVDSDSRATIIQDDGDKH